jgi:hypothetical protein
MGGSLENAAAFSDETHHLTRGIACGDAHVPGEVHEVLRVEVISSRFRSACEGWSGCVVRLRFDGVLVSCK